MTHVYSHCSAYWTFCLLPFPLALPSWFSLTPHWHWSDTIIMLSNWIPEGSAVHWCDTCIFTSYCHLQIGFLGRCVYAIILKPLFQISIGGLQETFSDMGWFKHSVYFCSSKKWKIIIAVAIIVVIVIILAIVLALVLGKKEGEQGKQEKTVPGPTEFIVPPLPTGGKRLDRCWSQCACTAGNRS